MVNPPAPTIATRVIDSCLRPARDCFPPPRWQVAAPGSVAPVGAPGVHADRRANSQLIGHLPRGSTEIVGVQNLFNLADC
jgi:hypothetical protein